ncbi:MAG: choice-of-anchor D domain-containing protein, partial [Actinomycetota bacterium]
GVLPSIGISPPSLSFPATVVGQQSASQTVTVTNTGLGQLTLGTIAFTGGNAGDFLRTGGTCSGTPLNSGASCTIHSAFRPTAGGGRSSTLSIASNAPGSPHSVPVSGTGVLAPAVSLSRTGIAFGNVELGTTSPSQAVTVTNTGGSNLVIGAVAVTGTHAGAFGLGANSCSSATIAPNGSCTIEVAFRPGTTGAHTASLSIPSNAAGSPHVVALTGTGVDSIAPWSAFSTGGGSILIAGLHRITGTASDAGLGVNRVTLTFTDLIGRATQTIASLTCNPGNHSCTWGTTVSALLAPGTYRVNARASDGINTESPGPTIQVYIV